MCENVSVFAGLAPVSGRVCRGLGDFRVPDRHPTCHPPLSAKGFWGVFLLLFIYIFLYYFLYIIIYVTVYTLSSLEDENFSLDSGHV